MTLIPDATRPRFQGSEPEAPEDDPAFFTEVLPAAFRTENLAVSALNSLNDPFSTLEDDFDPFEFTDGYEEYADDFARLGNAKQAKRLQGQIDRERTDRDVLAKSGVPGLIAQIGAGVVDPTVFIPVAGQVGKGKSILSISMGTAAASGVSTGVQEAGLQATQAVRTAEESFYNVAGATLLGGVLGAAVGRVAVSQRTALGKAIEKEFDPEILSDDAFNKPLSEMPDDFGGSSAGAAQNMDPALVAARREAELQDKGLAFVGGAAKLNKFISEKQRLQTSSSLASRDFAQKFTSQNLLLNENLATKVDGEVIPGQANPQSVEINIGRKTETRLGKTTQAVTQGYTKYLKAQGLGVAGRAGAKLPGPLSRRNQGILSVDEFNRRVSMAAHSGDVDEIPEIAEVAKSMRDDAINPTTDEAVELGMFGVEEVDNIDPDLPSVMQAKRPEIKNAVSYFPIIPVRSQIAAKRSAVEELAFKDFVAQRAAHAERFDALNNERAELEAFGVKQVRSDLRSVLKLRASRARKAKEKVVAAEKAAARADGKGAVLKSEAGEAGKRAKTQTSKLMSPEKEAHYTALLKDVERGHGTERPTTLNQFIRANGGIATDDLESYLHKDYWLSSGLGNNKSGKHLDYVREYAVERGYLPEDATLNDLGKAINDEIEGHKTTHHPEDNDILHYDEYVFALADALNDADIELTVEGLAGFMEGKSFVKATKFKKGKLAEVHVRQNAALKRLEGKSKEATSAHEALDDARLLARIARAYNTDLTKQADELRKTLKLNQRKLNALKRQEKREDFHTKMSDSDLRERARQLVDRMLTTTGPLPYDGTTPTRIGGGGNPNLSGRFKSRKMTWDPKELIELGVIESDPVAAVNSYLRGTVPDIELTKQFRSPELDGIMDAIDRDYAKLREGVPDGPEKSKLNNLQKKDKEAVKMMRDRARGTLGLPDNPDDVFTRVIREIKGWNMMSLMGGVTLSSIPDIANSVAAHGIGRFMKVPFAALTKGLRESVTKEAEGAGIAFEMMNNTRALTYADLVDQGSRGTGFERATSALRSKFGKVTLMSQWNHINKWVSTATLQDRIVQAMGSEVAGKINASDANLLRRLGIDETDSFNMYKMIEQSGQTTGLRQAGTGGWTSPGAAQLREKYHNALRQEVNRMIVTPGYELPGGISDPKYALLLQFKSFALSSTERYSMAHAQGMALGDANMLMTFTMQVGLGATVAAIKAQQLGIDTSEWTEGDWMAEAIDRSGVSGIMSEGFSIAGSASGGALSLKSVLGGSGQLTRTQSRMNLVGNIFGPTVGTAQAVGALGGAVTSEDELQTEDLRALRRLLPYQNLFYVRSKFDEMQEYVGDTFLE